MVGLLGILIAIFGVEYLAETRTRTSGCVAVGLGVLLIVMEFVG